MDTNVLSESGKPSPNARVVRWLLETASDSYISAISIGEIRRGIERLPDGERKTSLHRWMRNFSERFEGRIVSFNTATAHIWGQLNAKLEREGIVMASIDSQIAATAHRYGMILVTRNVRDFKHAGVRIFNPFDLAE